MSVKHFFYCLSGLLLIASCAVGKKAITGASGRSMSTSDYSVWAQSAAYPFRDTLIVNNVQFILEYQPKELEIARLLQTKRITAAEAREWLSDKSKNLHFLLTIITPEAGKDLYHFGLKANESGTERAAYYSFDFRKDIRLVHTDSLIPTGYLHERGIANYPVTRFNLDFAGSALNDMHTFTIYDRYFQQGWITFSLAGWNTQELPNLHIP